MRSVIVRMLDFIRAPRHHDQLPIANATFTDHVASEVFNFSFLSLEEGDFKTRMSVKMDMQSRDRHI